LVESNNKQHAAQLQLAAHVQGYAGWNQSGAAVNNMCVVVGQTAGTGVEENC
jgi:hypothetical protein